ncbi:hypothetical protein J5X84_41340 [Streptosporangiaceae bacterium NEAU-GS5]|nr:hypothetical protein [Streptosporangiaceae bacterium NEAU-GS5]
MREYEDFYNRHRAHQAHQPLGQAAPLRTVPAPIADPEQIIGLNVRRRDRLGVLHEYLHAHLNCTDEDFGRRTTGLKALFQG